MNLFLINAIGFAAGALTTIEAIPQVYRIFKIKSADAFSMPSLVAYVLDREGSHPGPAMGTFTAISDLGISLGPVIMGIDIHVTGYQVMFLCLALTGIINLIYFYFFVRQRG